MMGQAVGGEGRLFYEYNLEDRIPPNHSTFSVNPLSGMQTCPAGQWSWSVP